MVNSMNRITKTIPLALSTLLLLAACATAAPAAEPTPAPPAPTAMPKPTDAMAKTDVMTKTEVMADKAMTDTMAHDVMTKTEVMADKAMTDTMAHDVMTKTEVMAGDAMTKTEVMTKEAMAGDAMAMPAWQTFELTDVQTGQNFKLADYHGKTVYVELMATWCPNCKKQLGFVNAAKAKLANDNIVYVALSVESELAPAKLAKYATDTKYALQFAVLNADGLKAFSEAFGRTALNPPSTPHFIIKPDGSTGKFHTGYEDVNALVAELSAIK